MGMSALGPGPRVLPFAGGYYDQPAAAMDAFRLFDRWMGQRRREDAG